MENLGTLEWCLDEKDKSGNNFMHLTDCRFAPPFWKPFVKDKSEAILKQITKDLLK